MSKEENTLSDAIMLLKYYFPILMGKKNFTIPTQLSSNLKTKCMSLQFDSVLTQSAGIGIQ